MFPAPLFLILFSSLFNPAYLHAGIEELVILVSPDGKQHVILAGDIHDRQPGTQTERLTAAIAEWQLADPSPFEVYIEKPATLFTAFDNTPRITTDLEYELQQLNISGVAIHDSEVRNVAILASWLIRKKYPHGVFPGNVIKTGSKSCTVGEPTIQDLEYEFNTLDASISASAKSLPPMYTEKFDEIITAARNMFKKFRIQIEPFVHESNTIFDTAVNLANHDLDNPDDCRQERIYYALFAPFSELFNLNLIREIISNPHSKKLIVAGLLHTQTIREILTSVDWKMNKGPFSNQQSQNPEDIKFTFLPNLLAGNEE